MNAAPPETRYATPFAVLGIVTDGAVVTGVRYLPRQTAARAPYDRAAERACREIERYLDDPTLVRNIIADGCEKARKLAQETLRDVREVMGLDYTL